MDRACIIEQKQSNAARSLPDFVHLGRCAHTAGAVVDPDPDIGELGLPGRLFPAAAAAAAAAAAPAVAPAGAALSVAVAAAVVVVTAVSAAAAALNSTDLLCGCCCYVVPAVG